MDKCREAFEKHYLSLPFQTEWSAQICLDACSFDVKQDAYLPKMDWISSNDADECVIYCCMLNTAYLSFKEQQKRIDELNQENQKLVLSNTGYHNASASYLCKLMQVQFVLNQQTEIAKSKRSDGEVFEDKTETKISDYLDDYNIALDKILGDEATQEQFNAYAKGNEFLKQKARADKNQKQIDELQARVDAALFDMNQRKLELCESCDGYKDPVGVCQSEGLEMAINILKQALKGGEV